MTGESGGNRQSFDKSHFPQQADVLNIVLDHITQGMVVVGPDYRTLAFNRHFEEMFQLPPGTVEVGVDFREILKTWGHPTGDEVLKSFAAECRSVMRENDKMGRFGGEEFVMVLPETGKMDAALVAERIRRITAEMAVESKRGSALIPVTVSIGATTTTEGDDAEAVITRADEAMYDAKDAGRNRVVCH